MENEREGRKCQWLEEPLFNSSDGKKEGERKERGETGGGVKLFERDWAARSALSLFARIIFPLKAGDWGKRMKEIAPVAMLPNAVSSRRTHRQTV